MDITISFRHVDHDEKIREYVEEKISKLQKYVETPLDVHVVLSIERKYRHRVDVMLTMNGVVINAHEVMDDMHAAIDKILDKLERRLIRFRGKVKKYREGKQKPSFDAAEATGPSIIVTKKIVAKPMDPEEAAMQLEASGDNFMVFRERENDEICIIYKRRDGNFSLIETSGKTA